MEPCSLVLYRRFRAAYSLNHQVDLCMTTQRSSRSVVQWTRYKYTCDTVLSDKDSSYTSRPDDGDNTGLRNVGLLRDYTVPYSRRPSSSHSQLWERKVPRCLLMSCVVRRPRRNVVVRGDNGGWRSGKRMSSCFSPLKRSCAYVSSALIISNTTDSIYGFCMILRIKWLFPQTALIRLCL
jgi:hypothetical protein